ncbi:lipid A-modifier LpxR family protein [Maritimibacter sp. DP1N21-5]|uniref:lipid A-modifier LpxR family protein n=1 Tax=Maritimibacter sp. DP1N21-5 TaxID=2836867 RepID=UPI001C48F153|nr:lipid A-modifier LpxR family protein [Maritimibacter sp. DP1N21-5]MBV7410466.1 lipid A deacylase LpxR family protein [Maritimibacter sp. DP1N21-5]
MSVSFQRPLGFVLRLVVLIVLGLGGGLVALPARAQADAGWGFVGWGALSNNDFYGDRQDRWQTSSNSLSLLFGPKGLRSPPYEFGRLFELRSGYQIITPANTAAPAAGDRRAAGVLRGAVHNRVMRGAWEFDLGLGVEAVGPNTGVLAFQDRLHARLRSDRASPAVLGAQIGNRIMPLLHGEVAYRWPVSDLVTVRNYAVVHAGLEGYAQIGFDLLIGNGFKNGIFARDAVTGQIYGTVKRANPPGLSGLIGMDVSRVFYSTYLPSPAYGVEPLRARLRGGVMYDWGGFSVFYGATYLSREFTAQPQGQVVGSVQLRFSF